MQRPQIVHIDPAVRKLRDPDWLSADFTVFRNGGTVGSEKAIAFVEVTPAIRKFLSDAPSE